MAQGNGTFGKGRGGDKRSGGAKKRQAVKSGKFAKRKGSTAIENNKGIMAATKAINRKNERIIAAKACTAGTNFFLNDIAAKGKDESRRQAAARNKKENNKSHKMSDRLRDQIQKLK
jgi:hypothetical protein